jgi:hypothetical protein
MSIRLTEVTYLFGTGSRLFPTVTLRIEIQFTTRKGGHSPSFSLAILSVPSTGARSHSLSSLILPNSNPLSRTPFNSCLPDRPSPGRYYPMPPPSISTSPPPLSSNQVNFKDDLLESLKQVINVQGVPCMLVTLDSHRFQCRVDPHHFILYLT